MPSRWLGIAAALLAPLAVPSAAAPPRDPAASGPDPPGRIHGVIVSSDRVEDLSSIEAIRALVQEAATDREKAESLFRLAVKFRHQASPPVEYLGGTDHVHDPVKIFNVYGYCQCCCASALLSALARDNGMPSRGWALQGHSVPEIYYDGRWHMFDASLINYYTDEDGGVASVLQLARAGGALINRRHSAFIDEEGWYPARTHRAVETALSEYTSGEINTHEYTYTLGHRVGATLRAGERLVRSWANRGLHLGGDGLDPGSYLLHAAGPTGPLAYLAAFYPGYRMGLIGNGETVYAPDLATGAYRGGILSERNVASTADDGARPALHPASTGSAEVVIPFSSAYVFLGGRIRGRFVRTDPKEEIRIDLSFNHGLDWTRIWEADRIGSFESDIDVTPRVVRRYQYLLRIEMKGRAGSGLGIEALSFHHDIQHSQRALPLLGSGVNRITVRAPEPALATRTIEGSLTKRNAFNASFLDFHPVISHLGGTRTLGLAGAHEGTLTFPVSAPGEIRAVRFGGSFRCSQPPARIRLLVSEDCGRSWRVGGEFSGPPTDFARFVTVDGIAPGVREVLVRYDLAGPSLLRIFTFRIDVDYIDPLAGVRPVRVTYTWTQDGAPATDTRVVSEYPTTYSIEVKGDPIMRSLTLEGL